MKRHAFTLIEILIGTAILGVVGVPILSVFLTSKDAVSRTDTRRAARYYIREIYAHLGRQSLHDLWKYCGPGEVVGFDVAGQLKHHLAEFDANTGRVTGRNPLGFGEAFLKEMTQDGYDARVFFEFYTRRELEITPLVYNRRAQDKPSPKYGILHMQAGWASVYILDRKKLKKFGGNDEKAVIANWKEPIMCPAIVGRPGLKLSGCPAVNVTVREEYGPLLQRREAL
jgi:prepilin-type N-terminal cleavage/methylation domain-containing protein